MCKTLLSCTDMPYTTASLLDEPVVFSLLAGAIAHEGDSMVQLLCLPHAARLLVNTCIPLAHLSLSKAANKAADINCFNGFSTVNLLPTGLLL